MAGSASPVRVVPLRREPVLEIARVGGKAVGLQHLLRYGCPVPKAVCVTVDAYYEHIAASGLQEVVEEVQLRLQAGDRRSWETHLAALRARIIDRRDDVRPSEKGGVATRSIIPSSPFSGCYRPPCQWCNHAYSLTAAPRMTLRRPSYNEYVDLEIRRADP